jgi:hypothetical protein
MSKDLAHNSLGPASGAVVAEAHTPGPWERGYHDTVLVNFDAGGSHFTLLAEGRDCPVALIPDTENGGWGPPTDEHEANARLIAAAPDLLEALKGLLPTNIDLGNPNIADGLVLPCDVTVGELRKARAAIAKATGGDA